MMVKIPVLNINEVVESSGIWKLEIIYFFRIFKNGIQKYKSVNFK